MGNCQNVQLSNTRQYFVPQNYRCVVSVSPPEILIEKNDGSICSLPIKLYRDCFPETLSTMVLTHTSTTYEALADIPPPSKNASGVIPQLYFTQQNRVYYLEQFKTISNLQKQFAQTAYACYLMKKIALSLDIEQTRQYFLQISDVYLVKTPSFLSLSNAVSDSYTLVVQSQELSANQKVQFVDLVNLGFRMRQKGICWQDNEFVEIIQQVINRVKQLHQKGVCEVSNIILGSDGSVRLLGKYQQCPKNAGYQPYLRNILLAALYGFSVKSEENKLLFESQSKFKHPQSLKLLDSLNKEIGNKEKIDISVPIQSPFLKFIQGYIQAYFYKKEIFSEETLEGCLRFGNFPKAKQLCSEYIESHGLKTILSEEGYRMHYILVTALENMNKDNFPNQQQEYDALQKFQEICYHLAHKCLKNNQFSYAHYYYQDLREYSKKMLDRKKMPNILQIQEEMYLKFYELLYALAQYSLAEQIALEAIKRNKKIHILRTLYIFYLCDCLRLQEAQNRLLAFTKQFGNTEMEICSAKLFVMKATVDPKQKDEYLKRALQKLVIISESESQLLNANQVNFLKSYIFQVWGDLQILKYNLKGACQMYHCASIYFKKIEEEDLLGYRACHLSLAEGTCLIGLKEYSQAASLFHNCSQIRSEFTVLNNNVKANQGILKIKRNRREEGIRDLEQILEKTPKIDKQSNVNYIFIEHYIRNESM